MTATEEDIKEQMKFISSLVQRLEKQIDDAEYHDYLISNSTRTQNDIVRIRRELNDLRLMHDWRFRNEGI